MTRNRSPLAFDEIPTLYDRFRPGYPAAAIEALIELGQVPEQADVLEIGPGTGQLTIPLADRGLIITAVEPGPRLAQLVTRKLRRYGGAKVIKSRFEDADIPSGSFDLVVSATAFHWVDPETRYDLAAAALRPTGALALLRNDHVRGQDNLRYYERAADIYRHHAPQFGPPYEPPGEAQVAGFKSEMIDSGAFRIVEERRFGWDQWYDSRTLIGLLRTHSDHRALTTARRAALVREIRGLVDTELGGSFIDRYVTTVCIGREPRAWSTR